MFQENWKRPPQENYVSLYC